MGAFRLVTDSGAPSSLPGRWRFGPPKQDRLREGVDDEDRFPILQLRAGVCIGAANIGGIGEVASPPSATAQEAGEAFQDCKLCPEMVVVPPGNFLMGSPESEKGRWTTEGPQHEINIEYSFAVGVYEVTFDACVRGGGCGGYEPDDEGWGRGRRPVIHVHWEDAWRYADWLTEQTGEEYRLLTEAEWEYVARAGTRTPRYWGETDRAQCQYANGYDASAQVELDDDREPAACRDRQVNTAPVGSFRPNAFGLFDVLGNVYEWVDDCMNHGYEAAPRDGSPWYSGECISRMLRGGDWGSVSSYLRSAVRTFDASASRANGYGLRVARTIR